MFIEGVFLVFFGCKRIIGFGLLVLSLTNMAKFREPPAPDHCVCFLLPEAADLFRLGVRQVSVTNSQLNPVLYISLFRSFRLYQVVIVPGFGTGGLDSYPLHVEGVIRLVVECLATALWGSGRLRRWLLCWPCGGQP